MNQNQKYEWNKKEVDLLFCFQLNQHQLAEDEKVKKINKNLV